MRADLNKRSLWYGIPGLLFQTVGYLGHPIMGLFGSVLLILGLAHYARAKGHSGWYGLLGLFSWLGILVLIALKDQHLASSEEQTGRSTKPEDIILGVVLGLGIVVGVPFLIFAIMRLVGK